MPRVYAWLRMAHKRCSAEYVHGSAWGRACDDAALLVRRRPARLSEHEDLKPRWFSPADA
eukprot:32140-Eustigmatos_ZCMA.PRE.1